MFKIFGRVKEILSLVLDVAATVKDMHDLCQRMEDEHKKVLEQLSDIQQRVHTIERVEDLILRQNEQLLGRIPFPPDVQLPSGS